MDLFREDHLEVELNEDVNYACALNNELYFGTTDGRVLKYHIGKEGKEVGGIGIGSERGRVSSNEVNLEIRKVEEYTVKKNQKVEKIILLENESLMIVQVNDGVYCCKNYLLENLSLICKDANICTMNEKNKSDLLVYSMKKKKILFYYLENGKYKMGKEIAFAEYITSFLWINDSLFLTIQKNYYLYRLNKNEKILLYSHEYEQTYKHVTLINLNEIFIVCDLNIGVFYDVETSMPSRKNTITLVDKVVHLLSFRFFLCSMNAKAVVNIYNVNNQQHVQSISMNDYVDLIVNYSDVSSSFLLPIFLLDKESADNEGHSADDCAKGGDYTSGDCPNGGFTQDTSTNGYTSQGIFSETNFSNPVPHGRDVNETTEILQHPEMKVWQSEWMAKMEGAKYMNKSGENHLLKNYICFFNKKCVKLIRCQELFEYLPKCIQQNKIEKGFLLIENYIFENEAERDTTLNDYNKACAYHLFTNAQFALSFMHFERVPVNLRFLLTFWEEYLLHEEEEEEKNNNKKKQDRKQNLNQNLNQNQDQKQNQKEEEKNEEELYVKSHRSSQKKEFPQEENTNESQEMISKAFRSFLPPRCSVKDLIEMKYSSEWSDKRTLQNKEIGKYAADSMYCMKEKEKEKKKLQYIANNCLIKYLLMKRNEFIHEENGMVMGLYEEYNQITEIGNVLSEGSDTNTYENGVNRIRTMKNILDIIDNLLIKIMVINQWPNFFHFISETRNLHINVDECIKFLKKHLKFVETMLIYIRMKRFERAIEMCSMFLHFYNAKLNDQVEETNSQENFSEKDSVKKITIDEENTEKCTHFLESEKLRVENKCWMEFFKKQKFSKNAEKGTPFHSLLKEIYNILIVLNGNVHMINIEKSEIKKLFENSFPFLIQFNENAFFDFIINKNFLLKPEEILDIFKNMQKQKFHINIKNYMQKYVLIYLKYDKFNKNVNTTLVQFYLNDVEKPEQVRQKKILQFLRASYPLDIPYLIRIIPHSQFTLVKALFYGRMDKHYESLSILAQQNIIMCEKYCLYHNFLLKESVKKMSKEKYEELFRSLYKNDKDTYEELFKQMRKYVDLDEPNVHFTSDVLLKGEKGEVEDGNKERLRQIREVGQASQMRKKERMSMEKKKKKLNDAFIDGILKEYHKYAYATMHKSILTKMGDEKKSPINSESNNQNEERIRKEKEFDFMLDLIEHEKEDSSSDNLTDMYYNGSENSCNDASTSDNSISSFGKMTTDSDIVFTSSSDNEDDVTNVKIKSKMLRKQDRIQKKKNKNKTMMMTHKKEGPSSKKNCLNKKKQFKNDDIKKEEIEQALSNKHRNINVDILNYFDVYRSFKSRSCGFFFLLIIVLMDKHNESENDQETKEMYQQCMMYILNKYANHTDFENIHILNIIPKEWKLTDILIHFVSFNLKKKINLYMNLQIYHNLLKSNFLNRSYELIKGKENRILIRDKIVYISRSLHLSLFYEPQYDVDYPYPHTFMYILFYPIFSFAPLSRICKVCNGSIVEKRFAYFSEKVVTHMQCLEQYDEEIHK
ncbi:vacuolar protein sorting-associated protein 3 [Plasmodium gonderi]|uniref:Vacuolar protein sorting-associated protein 3 n=1 Tax=Plasmodium gonderi TaxID=77519 RepID=A0A1Y1JSQ2_PLAGO|nr:vacuolar protein sorting-associated protein 3 [Plasmodium gonderi]GAW82984.1 vacuolar protein sorting-associated protein 3 [Plasmodium gonderi]